MKFYKVLLASLLGSLISGIIGLILWAIGIFAVVNAFSEEELTPIKANSVLEIELSQFITDSPSANPLAGFNMATMDFDEQITLLEAIRAIETAENDANIKGIYLHLSKTSMLPAATLEELRRAISKFKESGKFVVAYNDFYTQSNYYLCSVADKVYMQGEGTFMWKGMTTSVMFYKDLLDKLDIEVEVFRPTVCKYKSAVEPFILNKMSDANRKQMTELIGSMWSTIAEEVALSRSLTIEKVNEYATNISCMKASDALECGMIDGVVYENDMTKILGDLGVAVDNDSPRTVDFGDYVERYAKTNNNSASNNKVGIIYAEGDIVDGEGVDEKIYGDITAATIKKARLDKSIKAVVLRVNSPGGSALASDVMWHELELLREVKPLIVSMGSLAASGGYYISAPADAIVANKLTLTGSIGVFGMLPNIEGALRNKLGVNIDRVKTNENADFMESFGGMTPYQRNKMIESVDQVYERFTSLVAKGRNLPIDKVLEIAQGRVWSGTDAVEIGLVDGIGGLRDAIALAVTKADLGENFAIVEVLDEPSEFEEILSMFSAEVAGSVIPDDVKAIYNEYSQIREALAPITTTHGMVSYSPYRIDLGQF